jgi:hypothetical protein
MRALPLLILCAWSPLALADAVPGPPPCPPGQVGVATHDENGCYEAPPKDCPAGWYPQLGGKCVVRMCINNDDCGDGMQCKSADVCTHDEMHKTGPRGSGPKLKVAVPAGVCSDGIECPDDNECRKAKICLPKGAAKPNVWTKQPKPTKPKAPVKK